MSPGGARWVVRAFAQQAPARQALTRMDVLPAPLTSQKLEIVRSIEDGLSY